MPLGILAMVSAGSVFALIYLFSEVATKYSMLAEDTFFFKQCVYIGIFFGVGVGAIYDRLGSKWSLVIATALLCSGLLVLSVITMADELDYWSERIMYTMGFICGQGACLTFLSVLITNHKNFLPANAYYLVPLLLSYYGVA